MITFDARGPIVIGNWKQNTNLDQAVELAERIAAEPVSGVRQAICPPAIWLTSVQPALSQSGIDLGAQSVSAFPNGAFTGELSASMVAEVCSFALVGHSERRLLMGETDAVVNGKLHAALGAGLGVVLCVGETADQRDAGTAEAIVARQLQLAFRDIERNDGNVAVAYEPVWAIGAGRSASAQDARDMTSWIAGVTARLLRGPQPPVLYGGSVTAANAAELFAGQHVAGFLVGGVSLRADEFTATCRAVAPRL